VKPEVLIREIAQGDIADSKLIEIVIEHEGHALPESENCCFSQALEDLGEPSTLADALGVRLELSQTVFESFISQISSENRDQILESFILYWVKNPTRSDSQLRSMFEEYDVLQRDQILRLFGLIYIHPNASTDLKEEIYFCVTEEDNWEGLCALLGTDPRS